MPSLEKQYPFLEYATKEVNNLVKTNPPFKEKDILSLKDPSCKQEGHLVCFCCHCSSCRVKDENSSISFTQRRPRCYSYCKDHCFCRSKYEKGDKHV